MLLGLLLISLSLTLAQSAQVWMQFNGQQLAYDTDGRNDLSPNYEQHAPLATPTSASKPTIDFSTAQMSHTQHTDDQGIVFGKYSYYDAAGYHELSYKAGAGIGFVVMGGNLAKPSAQTQTVAAPAWQYA
ncbi:CG13022 [Drosophila busckii]|uniref:CG13022 n=1 Tax=Drosophila busckii TaxID=30019 RepID=A0A0M4ENR6_DROBS|nr:CG13022 [Drosophila busckii]